jgi:hypothetical protein
MQSDRQLDNTEAGREVAADTADHVDDPVAHLRRDLRQLVLRQTAQVAGVVDLLE